MFSEILFPCVTCDQAISPVGRKSKSQPDLRKSFQRIADKCVQYLYFNVFSSSSFL